MMENRCPKCNGKMKCNSTDCVCQKCGYKIPYPFVSITNQPDIQTEDYGGYDVCPTH